jgi:hypothetical protein
MRDMRNGILLLTIFILSGCTNYLYQGNIKALDSEGNERNVTLYWNKTVPFIGDDKAGPASLITECGNLITFDEQVDGIVFRGSPDRDVVVSTGLKASIREVCGEFLKHARFVGIGEGELQVMINCKPQPGDEFSLSSRRYIAASETPYTFNVSSHKEWSLLGKTHQSPAVPDCRE